MINSSSKINLSKIGWEGGGSTSIWIMSLNILFFFFLTAPLRENYFYHWLTYTAIMLPVKTFGIHLINLYSSIVISRKQLEQVKTYHATIFEALV